MRSDLAPQAPPAQVLDESSLLTLYESTASRLHRYAARRVGADTAEDVVSEAFLVLWDQRGGQEFDADALRAWLFGVATNLLRRHLRTEERKLRAWGREHAAHVPVGDPGDQASSLADAAALAGPMAGWVAELRVEEREVLLLTAWAELSPAEIAVALDVPVATVRTRLHRARARLRTKLATEGENRE